MLADAYKCMPPAGHSIRRSSGRHCVHAPRGINRLFLCAASVLSAVCFNQAHGQELPIVRGVELQPLAAQVRRVAQGSTSPRAAEC